MKFDYGIGDRAINVKHRDLKGEFYDIQYYYLNKPITSELIEEMNNKYEELFHHFNLNDLKWELVVEDDRIIFQPLRPIDEFAITGIFVQP